MRCGGVATQSPVGVVDTALSRIDDLARVQLELLSKVNVALRFVDWYSRKGEAYQHNAAVVEQHLDKLVAPHPAAGLATAGGSPSPLAPLPASYFQVLCCPG